MHEFFKNIANEVGLATNKPKDRVPRPKLPKTGELSPQDKWKSMLWMIDTAESHGVESLRGLSITLALIIKGDIFSSLFFDARMNRQVLNDTDSLLWDSELILTEDNKNRDEILGNYIGTRKFDIQTTAIIPMVWEPWRLARALNNIGEGNDWGKWKQAENHCASAWYPWPIIWVSNGNHSLSAAIIKSSGFLECPMLDASSLLRAVSTDGEYWVRDCDGVKIADVHSMAMAGVFEIGRRLINLM